MTIGGSATGKNSILDADEDAETVGISSTLLKSSASYRNDSRIYSISDAAKNSLQSKKSSSLSNEVFGSINSNQANGTPQSEDELDKALRQRKGELSNKRDEKALNKDEPKPPEPCPPPKRRVRKGGYKRPRNFA